MRLFVFNWLLLASVDAVFSNGRQERDLPYHKNLIFGRSQINVQPSPVLQKENGYKLWYDNIAVKAAPKNTPSSTTRVATKTNDNALVSSLNPTNYVVEENIKTAPVFEARPVVAEVIDNAPVFTELIENIPVISAVIRPLEEKVEKVIQNNESVMTYIAQNNPGVELIETLKTKTKIPTYIKGKVDEGIVLSAGPNRFAPVQEVLQYQRPPFVSFSYPRIDTNSYVQNTFREEVAPVQEAFQYQSPQIYDPRVEANSFRKEVLTKGFGHHHHHAPPHTLTPLKYSPIRYNGRPTKPHAINLRSILLNLYKCNNFGEYISASKDYSQTKKVKVFKNLWEEVNICEILGPIPPQYITHVDKKSEKCVVSNGNMKQMKVPIESSKDNISNAKIPDKVYELQSNPNTEKVIKESRGLKTNTYRFIVAPPVNSITANKDVVCPNKVTETSQNVTHPVVTACANAPKPYVRTAIIHETDVNGNKTYYYEKTNADGYSLNVTGNKHGVSVTVVEHNNSGRLDIPDL